MKEFQRFDDQNPGGGGNPVLERLRMGRARIMAGWVRNLDHVVKDGRDFYCLQGAIMVGGNMDIFNGANRALEMAGAVKAIHNPFAIIRDLPPDDLGERNGYGRGHNTATFNNLAQNKHEVLAVFDKAIAAQEAVAA